MKVRTRLKGMPELRARLSKVADTNSLGALLEATAEEVRRAAVAGLADSQPPDSRNGALARSLTVTPGGDGLSFTLSTPLNYGWHLEYGSLHRPATPWLGPAFDTVRPSIERHLREWLTRATRG
jgi:hypothetical protein